MSILWLDDYYVRRPKNHVTQRPRIMWDVALVWLGCGLLSLLTMSGVYHLARIAWGWL
jgi:hypothetical protein